MPAMVFYHAKTLSALIAILITSMARLASSAESVVSTRMMASSTVIAFGIIMGALEMLKILSFSGGVQSTALALTKCTELDA